MLKSIAPYGEFSVKYSEYTNQWYVEVSIDVSDGTMLSGGTEHVDAIEEAVPAYLDYLKAVEHPKRIITRMGDVRHAWRWNGAAFALVSER